MVFATETLALGINMPARSVVIEKLVKWNGETHADITPGEYTQLTGRAGRRGIDVEGHGVVLWNPDLDPKSVAGTRLDPDLSAPVVVPPVVQHGGQPRAPGRPHARPGSCSSRRSRSSRPTRRWSGWPGSSARPRRAWAGTPSPRSATAATSWSTPGSGDRLCDVEVGAGAGPASADRRHQIVESMESLRPGDVIEVPPGSTPGSRW